MKLFDLLYVPHYLSFNIFRYQNTYVELSQKGSNNQIHHGAVLGEESVNRYNLRRSHVESTIFECFFSKLRFNYEFDYIVKYNGIHLEVITMFH